MNRDALVGRMLIIRSPGWDETRSVCMSFQQNVRVITQNKVKTARHEEANSGFSTEIPDPRFKEILVICTGKKHVLNYAMKSFLCWPQNANSVMKKYIHPNSLNHLSLREIFKLKQSQF